MEPRQAGTVYTVGHSAHAQEDFIYLLQHHNITAISDVRSIPYSRINPQFNREDLKAALRAKGISYVFLGKELGARTDDPSCYVNGKVQYERLATTENFRRGVERVMTGMHKHRIALMCAEKEPLDCHRTILVAKNLVAAGVEVQHILADRNIENHADTMARLLRQFGIQEEDMFRTHEELISEAYERQEERIAYTMSNSKAPSDSQDAVTV